MAWIRFSQGLVLDPVAQAEALVVLLHDRGECAETLTPLAARWATAVPTAGFIIPEGAEQHEPPLAFARLAAATPGDPGEPAGLDHAAHWLEPLIAQQLRAHRLDPSRLVLVGYGYGGTLALHMGLRRGLAQAGTLAFAARLTRSLARFGSTNGKVRVIAYAEDENFGDSSLGEFTASLIARGIDTRGVLMSRSAEPDVVIRHGGAYLAELVATAQRGGPFGVERQRSRRR